MRKIIFLLLLLDISTTAYNQTIRGAIHDELTRSPIHFSAVYFNGTFAGTHSDQNGYFELDISKNISKPLTVSALGYYSITVTDLVTDKFYRIYLTPKIFELNEVIISAKGKGKARRERNANLKSFRDDFLGTTFNAQKCKVTNENDITFKYDYNTDTLKAYSLKPILIENGALGYRISYYLDKFESCKKDNYLLYSGSIVFREDLTANENQKKRYERRRKIVYLGSRMHFFRSLWKNDLESSGYSVLDSTYKKLNYENFVTQSDTLARYITHYRKLFIAYYTKDPETSVMMVKDSVYFDRDGYFDAFGIRWNGEMAKYRIADCLPFEYSIEY